MLNMDMTMSPGVESAVVAGPTFDFSSEQWFVIALVVIQGGLTAFGAALGSFVPDAHLSALTATGGLLLVGVALRLLDLKQLKVADLLPALLVAPLLVQAVAALR